MKRLFIILLCFAACCVNMLAQNTIGNNNQNRITNGRDANGNQIDPNMQPDNFRNDSTEVETAAPKLYQWRVSENLG